jgi:Flp pilus assembly CpaE family ATPase
VALVDLDLNCGVQSLLTRVESKHSLTEMVRRVQRSGGLPAENLITRAGDVDIFANDKRSRTARLDTKDLEDFFCCLERAYPLVVVDHSGNWERYSVQILHRSAAVYSVCCADPLSVNMADAGRQLFSEDSVENVELLLSRAQCRGAVHPREAASTLRMSLFASLPNAYSVLQKAARVGGLASRSSSYGEAVWEFASRALERLGLRPEGADRARGRAKAGVLAALGLSAQL